MPSVGSLVPSTEGGWMILPPQHCPNGHRLGRTACWSVISRVAVVATTGTPPGSAWPATPSTTRRGPVPGEAPPERWTSR
jgi:hypothetical protein